MRFTFCSVACLLITFFCTGLLFSQTQGQGAQTKPKIAAIHVEGNIKSDADLIVIASGLVVGQEFTLDDVQKAIEHLWDMNVFRDIQVFADQAENGIALTFHVVEYPRLEAMEISGTDEIDEKDIRSQIGLFVSQTVSPQHIKKASERIRKQYALKGYLNAKIDVTSYVSETDTAKILLKIKIDEGDKVKIRRIDFYGNESYSDRKLRGTFDETSAKAGFFKWFKSGDFDEKKYREDLKKTVEFYKKHGFRDMVVVKDSVYYAPNNKDLFIDVWVEEGVKYYIGDVSWSGNTLFSNLELSAALGFDRGDVFDQEKYDRAMQERVNALYYDRGYIYAQIVPVEKPVGKDTLNLEFIVTEGTPVSIDMVQIKNNTKTKEKVIRREVFAFPGETFSREALIRTQRNLMVLNYFENVIPDIQPSGPDKVNVVITVTEKPTDTANLSMGYSAQDGLIGSAGIAFNNFLGNGQTVSLNIQLGGQGYRVFSVGFSEPYLFNTRTSFGASMYYTFDGDRRASYYGYKSRSYGGSVTFGRRFKWPDDYFSASWGVAYGNQRLAPLSADNVLSYITYGHHRNVTLTQIIQRDSKDAAEFPRTGSTYTLSTDLAFVNVDTVGFSNFVRVLPKSYTKSTFRMQNYIPALWSFVFYTEMMFGYARTFHSSSSVEEIPIQDRFYMGGGALDIGSTQLRGYSFRNVGPKIQGYAIGGSTQFKYSAEIRLPIIPNPTMYILAFAEAGNVYPSIKTTDPFNVKRSVGYGFRLFMPLVGVIGLDVGYGIDKISKKSGYPKFHLQLGPQF